MSEQHQKTGNETNETESTDNNERRNVKIIWEVPEGVLEARNTFRRDLPRLLVEHEGRWVAYQRDKQLAIADTEIELYERFNPDGSLNHEFFTGWISPM